MPTLVGKSVGGEERGGGRGERVRGLSCTRKKYLFACKNSAKKKHAMWEPETKRDEIKTKRRIFGRAKKEWQVPKKKTRVNGRARGITLCIVRYLREETDLLALDLFCIHCPDDRLEVT